MKTFILYGMRWSGKTTIGKNLAEKLNYCFYDLDQLIVADIGMSVFDFVEQNGWDQFRKKEHENLCKVLERPEDKVISLGGGAITFENNQNILLKKWDRLVYIECPIGMIRSRIEKDEADGNKRNSLTWKWLQDELDEIYEKRKECYESFYDFKVQNTSNIEDCTLSILEKINFGRVCVPIIDFELNSLKEQITLINWSREIMIVELRIDFIKNQELEPIFELLRTIKKQVILTNRNSLEWGKFEGDFEKSSEKLLIFSPLGDFIDIEILAWEAIHLIQEKRVILSYHDFNHTPSLDFLIQKIEEMSGFRPYAYKIAVMPKTSNDLEVIYRLHEHFRKNYPDEQSILISMGELWKETRLRMPQMGSMLTFWTLQDSSAPGQIGFKELYNLIYNS